MRALTSAIMKDKNLQKKSPNNVLNKLEQDAKPRVSINRGDQQRLHAELDKIEALRQEILADIAKQADLKIKQEEVIQRALHNIDYNQKKVEDKQAKLRELEEKYNLFYKRKNTL